MTGRVVSVVAMLLLSSPLRSITFRGPEFQVNAYTSGKQERSAVARATDGDFVVVWQSWGQDGSSYGIFGRRFHSSGAAEGLEFQVNSTTLEFQHGPDVGLDAAGNFVVVWYGLLPGGSLESVIASEAPAFNSNTIFARRFDSAGASTGGEFVVGMGAAFPSVGVDADGDFVVAWEAFDGGERGIVARRYDSSGNPGSEFAVNTYTSGEQRHCKVGIAPDGDFVIVWRSYRDQSEFGVFGRRFDAGGTAVTDEFQVTAYTLASQSAPRVDMSDDGAFVVVWWSGLAFVGDNDVFARRFDSLGAPQGGDILVHSQSTLGNQVYPAVAVDARGAFVVSWQGPVSTGSGHHRTFARAFDAQGSPRAAPVMVNRFTVANQFHPALGIDEAGEVVVTWDSQFHEDANSIGVFARRLAPVTLLDVDGDGLVLPLTDGLLVLRYEFGFHGDSLTSGAIGIDCTRCTADQIEVYLGGLH